MPYIQEHCSRTVLGKHYYRITIYSCIIIVYVGSGCYTFMEMFHNNLYSRNIQHMDGGRIVKLQLALWS